MKGGQSKLCVPEKSDYVVEVFAASGVSLPHWLIPKERTQAGDFKALRFYF
jgi:hypothetical protein